MKQTKTLWMALVAFLAIGLSSCNDEIADYKTELKSFREALQQQTTHTQTSLDELRDKLEQANLNHATYGYVDAAAEHLQIQVDSMKGALTEHQSNIDYLLIREQALQTSINDLTAATAAAQADATKALKDAKDANDAVIAVGVLVAANSVAIGELEAWRTGITSWKTEVTADLDSTRYNAYYALCLAKADSIRIDQLENDMELLKERDGKLYDSIVTLYDTLKNYVTREELKDSLISYLNQANHYSDSLHTLAMDSIGNLGARLDLRCDELNDSIESLKVAYQYADSLLQDQIDTLNAKVTALTAQVLENTRRIDSLCLEMDTVKNRLDNIEDHLDRAIYSLALQGSVNTVFGYAAIPGYYSNILISYYGKADDEVKFPTTSTGDLVNSKMALPAADAAFINIESFTQAGGTILPDNYSNAGKLYFQLNPVQANLDATEFKMVNSIGAECALTIDSIKASNDVLTYGYTPSGRMNVKALDQSANGFYEAYTSVTEDAINDLKININEELKSAAKNVLDKGIRNVTGSDLATLAKTLFDQMNGLLPRYALQATWEDSLGVHTVNSDYDIAATTVKPLSYTFYANKSLRQLRKINPIQEANIDLSKYFKFKFDTIKVNTPDFSINFNIEFEYINIDDYGDVMAKVKVPAQYQLEDPTDPTSKIVALPIDPNDPTTYKLCDVDLKDYKAWVDTLVNDINRKVDDMGNNIEEQVQTKIAEKVNDELGKMIKNLQDEVNKMINNANGSLSSNIENINDKINSSLNKYISQANKFIKRMNNLIDRLNKVLKDPNHYLQPVLVYTGADGQLHMMSQSKVIPSVFKGTGSIVLYPTSYTAEIAAPAYKKFIAVTDVYSNDDWSISAQNGDADCQSKLNAANASYPEYINTVIDGSRYAVSLGGLQSGYTYKVFYSAMDYRGKISQNFYYVSVK